MNIRLKQVPDGPPQLLFCCSGVADTAEIADRAVRQLHKDGAARMYCLAGIAAKAELIVNGTQGAGGIIVVDGCDTDCGRLTMEAGGFTGFTHLRVTDLGMEKSKSPVTPERIQQVIERVRELLGSGAGSSS